MFMKIFIKPERIRLCGGTINRQIYMLLLACCGWQYHKERMNFFKKNWDLERGLALKSRVGLFIK